MLNITLHKRLHFKAVAWKTEENPKQRKFTIHIIVSGSLRVSAK